MIKKPICFKGSPSCIGLIIIKRKACFKKPCVLETRTSYFHKLTAVSLKSQILRAPPKQKLYRDYKAFDEKSFNNDLKTKLDSITILNYSSFKDIFRNVVTAHAPIKNKNIRANNHGFMTTALRNSIKTRSRLKMSI